MNSMAKIGSLASHWKKFCYFTPMRPIITVSSLLGLILAEGTRELMANNCNNHGYIQIWDNNDPPQRLCYL